MHLRALDPCQLPDALPDGRLEILRQEAPWPRVIVRLRPQVDLSAVLAGRTGTDALRVARRLLPGGGWSHRLACLSALDAATGRSPDPATARARALLVQAEVAVALVAQGCLAWPRLLGLEPKLRDLRYARTALDTLVARLWRGGDPLDPGAPAAPLGEAELPVSALIEALEKTVLPYAPADAAELAAWAVEAPTPLARLARAAMRLRLDTWVDPPTAVPGLPDLALALAEEAGFGRAPHVAGAAGDPTAFARLAPIPGAARFGPVGERLLARAAQAQAVAEALARLDAPAIATYAPAPGIGAALVEGVRGPVVHRLVCDAQGRVLAFASVTPADWHLHRDGPLATTLAGLPGERFAEDAPLVLAAFDPCDAVVLRQEPAAA